MTENKPQEFNRWLLKQIILPIVLSIISASGGAGVMWWQSVIERQRLLREQEIESDTAQEVIDRLQKLLEDVVGGESTTEMPEGEETIEMSEKPFTDPPKELIERLQKQHPNMPKEEIRDRVRDDWKKYTQQKGR